MEKDRPDLGVIQYGRLVPRGIKHGSTSMGASVSFKGMRPLVLSRIMITGWMENFDVFSDDQRPF